MFEAEKRKEKVDPKNETRQLIVISFEINFSIIKVCIEIFRANGVIRWMMPRAIHPTNRYLIQI